ncbi:helix-turn-helix domain-containing protein [Xenorhabdus koppenhoeferi]
MITRLSAQWPVTELCQAFKVSRSAYYDWRKRPVDTVNPYFHVPPQT